MRRYRAPLLIAGILGAGALGYGAARIQAMLAGGDINEIAQRLPIDTPGLLVVRGATQLFLEFGGALPDTTGLPSLVAKDLESMHDRATADLGFDPLTRSGWESTGLDFFRPGGLSIDSMNPTDSTTRLVLPVSDSEQLATLIAHLLSHSGLPHAQTTILDREAWIIAEQIGLVLDDDQLLGISNAEPGFDAKGALSDWLSSPGPDSLANATGFQRVVAELGDQWQALAYASPLLMNTLKEQALGELPGGVAWAEHLPVESGYALHLDNNRLRTRYGAILPKPPPLFFQPGSSGLAQGISGDALLSVRAGLDLPAWLEQIEANEEMQNALDYALALGSGFIGANLHTEGLENLSGQVGLAVLTPMDATKSPLDAVAWLEFKTAQKSAHLVESLCAAGEAMLGMQIDANTTENSTWCHSEIVGLGMAQDHLILTAGAGRAVALKDALASKDEESHLNGLPSTVKAGMESNDVLHFWLDVRGLSPLAQENVLPEDIRKWIQGIPPELLEENLPMSGFSGGVELEPDFASAELNVHAPAGGFSAWLPDAGHHIQELANAYRSPSSKPGEPQPEQQAEEMPAPADDALLAAAKNEVTQLRQAVLDYRKTFGAPSDCSDEATAREALQKGGQAEWRTLDCFTELGWIPSGRFVLWLVVDGSAFEVHALVDLSVDGEPVHILATHESETHRVNEQDEL